jgi:Domain of unknown function DUF29
MSGSDRRALESHLRVLLVHLLKWGYQPAGHQPGHSWADSIREARTQVADGLQTHPGLHQIRRQVGEQGEIPGSRLVFDGNVLPLRVAKLTQPLPGMRRPSLATSIGSAD